MDNNISSNNFKNISLNAEKSLSGFISIPLIAIFSKNPSVPNKQMGIGMGQQNFLQSWIQSQ